MENTAITQEVKPPNTKKGPVKWLKDNLFNTWYNTILTCLGLAFLFFVFKGVFTWVFTQADWEVIPANLQIFSIGPYPLEQIWRVSTVIYGLAVLLGLSAGIWNGLTRQITVAIGCIGAIILLLPFHIPVREHALIATVILAVSFAIGRNKDNWKRWVVVGWVLSFPWTMMMLHGFGAGTVSTTMWGGLLLTLILAAVGIVACFPLGVLLALGRRSQLPAIRWVSTVYIETIRGVPLITLLFMGSILLPIFMPGDFQLDKVIRAMVALTLFSAAYMAENVRGGLQAIPSGQVEAAQAVGLTYPKTMLFIVLPQALRAVIPAIVGQFISLFKDTSLVSIVGLVDLLGVARSVLGNAEWIGLQPEVYLFVAAIYFVFCYAMSFVSQKIESDLGVGKH
ncbi:amino acid ABC transporter permease [Candidatus Poribacteria bacterium]|nr:amino acid ABC transporter permease [Candidatus Poribacteria bacterium]MYG07494.1 amino acid ABC transporter permease [Candidatus Poribacteria bacterium]MYK22842.1 amino acid ABC transporter permease [Candidatus Poribacteria bacterium]